MVQPRNLRAKPRTVTAGFDAVFHVAQRGTVFLTGLTYFGAQCCEAIVKLALAPQGVGGESAKPRTIQQHCHAICLSTAMTHCLEMGGEHARPQHLRLMLCLDGIAHLTAELVHAVLRLRAGPVPTAAPSW
jgi:hypothetical protein